VLCCGCTSSFVLREILIRLEPEKVPEASPRSGVAPRGLVGRFTSAGNIALDASLSRCLLVGGTAPWPTHTRALRGAQAAVTPRLAEAARGCKTGGGRRVMELAEWPRRPPEEVRGVCAGACVCACVCCVHGGGGGGGCHCRAGASSCLPSSSRSRCVIVATTAHLTWGAGPQILLNTLSLWRWLVRAFTCACVRCLDVPRSDGAVFQAVRVAGQEADRFRCVCFFGFFYCVGWGRGVGCGVWGVGCGDGALGSPRRAACGALLCRLYD
jgi:hypothetical protein